MIHSVGTYGAKGSLKEGLEYAYQERDHKGTIREEVTHLRGNPDQLLTLEATMNTKNTYLHTSLSYTSKEAKMLDAHPEKLDAVIDSYINQMAAGLPSADRLPYCCVKHGEPDKFHVEFFILRMDLETGKSYQPFVKQRGDISRFQDWNIVMQKEHGLENPNALERQRSAGWSKNLPPEAKAIRDMVDSKINQMVSTGKIQNRKQAIAFINQTKNMEVSRINKQSISIKIANRKHPIRMKGVIYGESFTNTRSIRNSMEEKAKINFTEARSRLDDRMRILKESSHHKYQENSLAVGRDTTDNMRDTVHPSTDMDVGQKQNDGKKLSSSFREPNPNERRQEMAKSPTVSTGSKGQDMGTTHEEKIIPSHKIFNGVQFFPEANMYYWEGGYGFAQVTETDLGYSLSHGSKMEWQMAAQLMKNQGHDSAHIICSSQQSMLRAINAHSEAGVRISTLTLNGEELSHEKIKEICNEHKKSIEASGHRITKQRTTPEGHTGSSLDEIESNDEQRNRVIEQQIDELERASGALDQIMESIEYQQEQEQGQELEFSR